MSRLRYCIDMDKPYRESIRSTEPTITDEVGELRLNPVACAISTDFGGTKAVTALQFTVVEKAEHEIAGAVAPTDGSFLYVTRSNSRVAPGITLTIGLVVGVVGFTLALLQPWVKKRPRVKA